MLMELLGRQGPSSSTASTRDNPSSRRITTPQRGQTPLPYGARSQLGFGGHCLVGMGMKTVPTRVCIGELQEHPVAPKFLPYNLFFWINQTAHQPGAQLVLFAKPLRWGWHGRGRLLQPRDGYPGVGDAGISPRRGSTIKK